MSKLMRRDVCRCKLCGKIPKMWFEGECVSEMFMVVECDCRVRKVKPVEKLVFSSFKLPEKLVALRNRAVREWNLTNRKISKAKVLGRGEVDRVVEMLKDLR